MARIALVISDVDGTLVTSQKRVTDRTRAAVAALQARGIGFTVVSSRPPFGLRMLVDTLGITIPVAAFNGGAIVSPALEILNQRSIERDVARDIVSYLDTQRIGVWLFTGEEWLTRDLSGAHVSHETITVQQRPQSSLISTPSLDRAGKIVGVSDDFARLAAIERRRARVSRRVPRWYARRPIISIALRPGIDKGLAVRELAETIGVPLNEIVTLGDMENDVPMFRQAGFSIAMGNASDAVKGEARETTLSNDEDGFAAAVEKLHPAARGRRLTRMGGEAPGWPGIPARWTSSAKSASARRSAPQSRVWFTISHGVLNEIYYPRIDHACTRDFGFIVTDGRGFFSEEKRDATQHGRIGRAAFRPSPAPTRCRWPLSHREDGDHRPDAATSCCSACRFARAAGALGDYRLFVLLAPHLGNRGADNTAWIGEYKGDADALRRAAAAPRSRWPARRRGARARPASSAPRTAGRICARHSR